MIFSRIYNVVARQKRFSDHPLLTAPPRQEHAALIAHLWAQGSVAHDHAMPADEKIKLAGMAFGTDEFAGDREVACFLASAATAADAETAAGLAADGGMTESQALERRSLLPAEAAVTLVAVPIHVGNRYCRYNPYHLRIVDREADGGGDGRTEVTTERAFDENQDDRGCWKAKVLPTELKVRKAGVPRPKGDDGGEGRNQDAEQAQADEPNALGVAEGVGGVERAYFSRKGVTFVNVHGETNFQLLDEWRQEKERFDTLSRMRFVRRYRVCRPFSGSNT